MCCFCDRMCQRNWESRVHDLCKLWVKVHSWYPKLALMFLGASQQWPSWSCNQTSCCLRCIRGLVACFSLQGSISFWCSITVLSLQIELNRATTVFSNCLICTLRRKEGIWHPLISVYNSRVSATLFMKQNSHWSSSTKPLPKPKRSTSRKLRPPKTAKYNSPCTVTLASWPT